MTEETMDVRPRVEVAGLSVDAELHTFVREEALPGTGVDESAFWEGAASIFADLGPRVRAALQERRELQDQIDEFHRACPGVPEPEEYEQFLRSIGYVVDEPAPFEISTDHVDEEIATIAGPQLVVPLLNARFATNAANARWGSLYDALYGTDAVERSGELMPGDGYNVARGAAVVARVRGFLDEHFPLASGSHADARSYRITADGLVIDGADGATGLVEPAQLAGYRGDRSAPTSVLLVHHGLHVEIVIDREHPVGELDAAGIADVVIESAVSTIMDLEDSVAAVDAADKVIGYRNWLLLMQRRLASSVTKGGSTFVRTMNDDREFVAADGTALVLPGRALLLVRQVGHLMTTSAVLDPHGAEVSEGILDALVTGLGSLHDLRGPTAGSNSRQGSVYVVKPKQHGPDEVELTGDLLARVEDLLGMPARTIKLGIMDEERRTSVNLRACVHRARDRVAFINTGFLDRTGDEIHTSMEAGPVVRKADMRQQRWIGAYEDANVDVGLSCGFRGRAQIGKGMWAAPDDMAAMLAQKAAHPRAGASCAWVPSPTAATLHALHYHQVDVAQRQAELTGQERSTLRDLLELPLGQPSIWSDEERREELDNNVQSTLGYVVRWVDSGVGCSKVPDLGGTQLMEDRATCRISSQHVSNWVRHEVVTVAQVEDSLRRMAVVVDQQNAGDPTYRPMAPSYDGEAFLAARELLLDGAAQPSGYTEPILHRRRAAVKASTTTNKEKTR
ncbi:malate synthase G [Nocardioides maradonensis]